MKQSILTIAVIYCLLIIILLIFIFPILFFIFSSFKPAQDIWAIGSLNVTFQNYIKVLVSGFQEKKPTEIFFHPLFNSLIISCSATIFTLIISCLAAYSLSRFNYRGRDSIAFLFLTLYMAPPIIFLVPLWDITHILNLHDTHIFLILCYTYLNIPLTVWLLRSFIISLPISIEESAMIDGCTRLGAFLKVTIPIMTPGLAVTAILAFILNWNEYLFASSLTATKSITLPVAISQYGFWLMIDWGTMTAMGTLTILPVFLLALIVQKYIVSGLTLGAVKG